MSEKPSPSKLSPAEVERRMREHPEWRVEEDKIRRRFDFDDFVGAFGFITRVALVAEAMQHHPEWSNVYGTVTIELSTHDVGGLSDKDFSLASAIDRLAAQG